MRVAGASLDPTAEGLEANENDVWMYTLVWMVNRPGALAAWNSLCQTKDGADDQSLLLSDRWDTETGNRIDQPAFITFACRDFALAQCARMGYRSWATANRCSGSGAARSCSDISLVGQHQACTRMMRADYCGNGTSYTVDGTVIDIYDYLNPLLQVPESDWDIEAAWTPKGALCLNEPRHPELLGKWHRSDCNGDGKADSLPACGQSNNRHRGRGLVVNRFANEQSKIRK